MPFVVGALRRKITILSFALFHHCRRSSRFLPCARSSIRARHDRRPESCNLVCTAGRAHQAERIAAEQTSLRGAYIKMESATCVFHEDPFSAPKSPSPRLSRDRAGKGQPARRSPPDDRVGRIRTVAEPRSSTLYADGRGRLILYLLKYILGGQVSPRWQRRRFLKK